ncbi:RNA polymerase sigma factor, partial [Actinophytocola sp.]|uniref:RNA polymerase sigma factor n=1 Tax=Actinophytocola sp. TaxID=1872138 RepID=UPI003899FCAB
VQETWLRAWRNVDRLAGIASVRSWLMRIAHNVAIDQHRRRQARPTEVELPDHGFENAAVAVAPCEEVETRIDVDAVLEHLPAAHRQTLVEVYFADRTAVAAATVLGVPVGTVKSRVHKALRTLRAGESLMAAA